MMRSRRKVLAVLGLVPFFGLVNTALAQKAGNTATQNKSATVPSAPSAQRTLPSASASQDEILR